MTVPRKLCSVFSSHLTKTTMAQPLVVSVEGNIAAGKTEFMFALKRKIEKAYGVGSVNLIPEPVQKWNDIGGEKLFDCMMRDPKRWAFTFQNYVQLSMFEAHSLSAVNASGNCKIHLVERSIHSARYVFVENHKRLNNITNMEYNVLNEFYRLMCDKMAYDLCNVDFFLYMDVHPEECISRLSNRLQNQDEGMSKEESRVTLEYMQSLENLYLNEFLSRDEFKHKVRVLDANRSRDEVLQLVQI